MNGGVDAASGGDVGRRGIDAMLPTGPSWASTDPFVTCIVGRWDVYYMHNTSVSNWRLCMVYGAVLGTVGTERVWLSMKGERGQVEPYSEPGSLEYETFTLDL